MGYTLDTGDTCMIVMISASFLIILCALYPSENVYMCIVQCLTYIVDHSDGSLPFHRWTNGQLPLETIEKPSCPMVAELQKHQHQWLLDQKPLQNHWYQQFVTPKTIDTNGCFPTLHLWANPSLFGIFFVEKGLASCSLINSAFY